VLANLPFSLEQWGRELWENDPYGLAFAGLPTDSSGDYAFIQHMVKSMAPVTGRMAVVAPQGALFRGGVEGQIRRKLLEMDLIEAVLGPALNLFYGTGLAACILVLRQRKTAARAGKVLIVDASSLFRKGRAQNFLDPEHGATILGWVRAFEDVGRAGACRDAPGDRSRRLDAQHLALCAAADRRGYPAAGGCSARLQGRAGAGARGGG
jgi:type I restriction enzyme M protein